MRSDAHGEKTRVCALVKFSKQCKLSYGPEGNEYRIVFEYSLQLFKYQNKTNTASLVATQFINPERMKA